MRTGCCIFGAWKAHWNHQNRRTGGREAWFFAKFLNISSGCSDLQGGRAIQVLLLLQIIQGLKSDPNKFWIKCCKGLSHRPYEPLLRAVVLESLGGMQSAEPLEAKLVIHDTQQAKHENPQNSLHEMYRNYS